MICTTPTVSPVSAWITGVSNMMEILCSIWAMMYVALIINMVRQ